MFLRIVSIDRILNFVKLYILTLQKHKGKKKFRLRIVLYIKFNQSLYIHDCSCEKNLILNTSVYGIIIQIIYIN